ncbi:MAG: polyphosphate kinase 1 [Pseudomonadota bacterium]
MSEMVTKLWRRLPLRQNSTTAAVSLPATLIGPAAPVPETGTGRFNNREISDLQFIERVLAEAHNEQHPLLERLRFLAISASVLDQFYAVRVAKLKRSAAKQDAYLTPDGLTPIQQLRAVLARAGTLMSAQQATWQQLSQALDNLGIHLVGSNALTTADVAWVNHFFRTHVMPVLTPCIIDEEHPFPFIPSGGVCAILEFPDRHILVPLPAQVSRFVPLPGTDTRFILLENMLFRCWPELFPQDTLLGYGVFQLLRDNDLAREERSADLRAMVESGLRSRHKANVVLLTVSATTSESAIRFIAGHLDIFTDQELRFFQHQQKRLSESERIDVTQLPGMAALGGMITPEVADQFHDHLFPPHTPVYPAAMEAAGRDCFAAISAGDVLVHWPYESFDSVVDFLSQAAGDPDVLAIKQTLYRTSDNSPIVNALIEAARAGKAVTTVVELEARENESSNVELAKRLEAAGVQIVYGIVGLKIHCKATLVVRREEDDTVSYSHLSTGNYHPGNARIYTDLSFFTKDPAIASDVTKVFNYLTSGTLLPPTRLLVAPGHLRNRLVELIDRQIALAASGKTARIVIKVNSMTDPGIIAKLYDASESGVDIDLIVRRHCSLRPGVPGMSSRIRVKSIVGRFLEHSRVYLFSNGERLDSDTADVLIGSPDLMERNLDERVEVLVPITDPALRARIVNEIMAANLLDRRQSWLLDGSNEYQRHPEREGFCSQTWFQDTRQQAIGKLDAIAGAGTQGDEHV